MSRDIRPRAIAATDHENLGFHSNFPGANELKPNIVISNKTVFVHDTGLPIVYHNTVCVL